jgi:flagellar biosynthesis protein FlhA
VSTEALPARPGKNHGSVAVPLAIIGIVLMMVLPLPPALLDVLLSCSMALAIGVFLTSLFIQNVLEFSAFPAFVLVATLLRLSLNVATTRLILLHGGEGHGAAGSVVEAFGRFVVEGNIVVGLVVFLILVVINFVVVTKGAGRVAEVAARFTLDAMPGKQMAIDADLSSGAITADQARKRRSDLEREADFFGAMDGSSKFVHGDAVAGLLITGINLIGGLVLGVSRGMDVGQAAETFSVLSVGDALATQIPALLVSAASGIVVTRSATGDQLGKAFASQLMQRRKPVMMTAGVLAVLSLVPGMPTLPCMLLAGAVLLAGRTLPSEPAGASSPAAQSAQPGSTTRPKDDIESALSLDMLSVELGYELVSVVDPTRGGNLLDRVAALRQQIARELGVVVPPVHVCDNLDLPPCGYRVLLLGNELASGSCRSGKLLAMSGGASVPPMDGEPTTDPTFGLPALWIHERDREVGEVLGYTVVDHSTILATHLGEVLRANAYKLLGRQETQQLLDRLARTSPKLVDDVVPSLLSLGDVHRVLRNLLREGISIRDTYSIMEALADLSATTKDSEQLTELVRERLSAQITSKFRGQDGSVAALALSPAVEDRLRESLRDIAAGAGAPPSPDLIKALVEGAQGLLGAFNAIGASPMLICAPDLRRFVRAIFERRLPQLAVVSFREIDPSLPLRVIGKLTHP